MVGMLLTGIMPLSGQVKIAIRNAAPHLDLQDVHANTFIGQGAADSLVDGSNNTVLGTEAMLHSVSGNGNTVMGKGAYGSQNGYSNTAIGYEAMHNGSTFAIYGDVAVGTRALFYNLDGYNNTSIGYQSMYFSHHGNNNTALGAWALSYVDNGEFNTAVGMGAQWFMDSGSYNTSVGHRSLAYINGEYNTAMGEKAAPVMNSGNQNTVIGAQALNSTYTASRTTAVGYKTGGDLEVGSFNTFVGSYARGTDIDQVNSAAIGDAAVSPGSNKIRIGDVGVSWIGGQVNWSAVSDARYKTNVRDASLGLDFINRLRPVQYEMQVTTEKEGGNGHLGQTYTGFIAQEVEQALQETHEEFSGLCRPDSPDGYYSLRYAEFTVPLVKAVQELTREINEQRAQLKAVEAQNARLEAEIAELHARSKS